MNQLNVFARIKGKKCLSPVKLSLGNVVCLEPSLFKWYKVNYKTEHKYEHIYIQESGEEKK